MKLSTQLSNWLSEKKMNLWTLLSIAFVPRRTFDDIVLKGSRMIPALHRLHLVTGLPEFELSVGESELYQQSKKTKQKTREDEMIAKALWKEWQTSHSIPEEDMLVKTSRKGKDKTILTQMLLKKHCGTSSPSTTTVKSGNDSAPSGINGTLIPTGILSLAVQELERAIAADDGMFERYAKTNAKHIKQISNLLSAMTQEDRRSALKRLSENLFSNA